VALGTGYFFWESAVDGVRAWIDSWALLGTLFDWLAGIGLGNLKSVLAPMAVVFLATPVIVILSLLAVAVLMTPSMLTLVTERRFGLLEKRRGGSFLGAVFGGLWATAAALLALVISLPLWFIPPLVLVLPPLIWGWLNYRVMSYDVLADHASAEERLVLMRQHRPSLLAMGVISGYLGAAPSLVWASGVLFVALAPVLVPLAVWVYTLVFAFSSLWFAHYALAALEAHRAAQSAPSGPPSAAPPLSLSGAPGAVAPARPVLPDEAPPTSTSP
jgi:Etoposide-induced protein 2.4 (EI24)